MSYGVDLEGKFTLDRPLTAEQVDFLLTFAGERHTPGPQYPDYYCQWVPHPSGHSLRWDGNEKFTCFVEWLWVLIEDFIKPWGYVLNGSVEWDGDERGDIGSVHVVDNVISIEASEDNQFRTHNLAKFEADRRGAI